MKNEGLIACPCCGGKAQMVLQCTWVNGVPVEEVYRVLCAVCKTASGDNEREAECSGAWNRRVEVPAGAEPAAVIGGSGTPCDCCGRPFPKGGGERFVSKFWLPDAGYLLCNACALTVFRDSCIDGLVYAGTALDKRIEQRRKAAACSAA